MPNKREKLIDLRREGEKIAENFCVSKQECYQCPYNTPNSCQEGLIADRLIANGVTFATDNNVGSKWIPVTERLPEDNKIVLICSRIGNQYVAQHFRGHFYSDGTRISTSHWMPLPEPPKGE